MMNNEKGQFYWAFCEEEALKEVPFMCDAIFKRGATTHNGRTGWRTGRTYLKIDETGGLFIESVQMQRFQYWIPHAGKIVQP